MVNQAATAPCTSMRNSFFCKRRKIPGEILKPCATVRYKRSFPKKPNFCRAHQHFWRLTLSKGTSLKRRIPLVKWMGRKCSQKSETVVQELGTNLGSAILIKSFCDTGSHRHSNLSNKPLLRMVLKFLDYFCSVETPGPSSTS